MSPHKWKKSPPMWEEPKKAYPRIELGNLGDIPGCQPGKFRLLSCHLIYSKGKERSISKLGVEPRYMVGGYKT